MQASSYSTPLIALDAIVLDTETTGLDARVAPLVQIAALRLVHGILEGEERFESLVNPGRPIPQAVVAVHGITDAMVAGAPAFAAIAARFRGVRGARDRHRPHDSIRPRRAGARVWPHRAS